MGMGINGFPWVPSGINVTGVKSSISTLAIPFQSHHFEFQVLCKVLDQR